LQIAKRLADFEISPSGPMWGSRMTRCGKLIDEIERECLQEFSLVPEQFSKLGRSTSGARRPLRVAVGQATADASEDEHGKFIELSFELPPGSYATVVLRAITGALRRNNEEDLRIDQP
jgi:tRNA pseudouridine13 synthase